MKMTIWKCDRCGKEYRPRSGSTFIITTGTERDAVEGRTFDKTDSVDMCNDCVYDLLTQLLRAMPMERKAALVEEIKARCPN